MPERHCSVRCAVDHQHWTAQLGYLGQVPKLIAGKNRYVGHDAIRADEGAAALKQVAGPLARIEPVARSNALLITDRGANVARYLELLRRLDERPQGESGLRTYVVPLKYANAEDLAYALGQSYEVNVATGRGPSLADRSLSRLLRDDWPRTLDELERSRRG